MNYTLRHFLTGRTMNVKNKNGKMYPVINDSDENEQDFICFQPTNPDDNQFVEDNGYYKVKFIVN